MKQHIDPKRSELRTISVHTLEAVTGGCMVPPPPKKTCVEIFDVEICF